MSAGPRPSGSTSSGSVTPETSTLVETRVERTDSTVRIVHVFEYGPQKARLLTEPIEGYGGED